MLYLNESGKDFEGGYTQFLPPQQQTNNNNDNDSNNNNNKGKQRPRIPVAKIKPEVGTVVIFTQDALHEGLPVEKGSKFIMRTDIMFRRVAGDWVKPYSNEMYAALTNDPSYLKTIQLLDESEKNEKSGKLVESTGKRKEMAATYR